MPGGRPRPGAAAPPPHTGLDRLHRTRSTRWVRASRTCGSTGCEAAGRADRAPVASRHVDPTGSSRSAPAGTSTRPRRRGASPNGAHRACWYAPAPWQRQSAVGCALVATRPTTAAAPTRAAASRSPSSFSARSSRGCRSRACRRTRSRSPSMIHRLRHREALVPQLKGPRSPGALSIESWRY